MSTPGNGISGIQGDVLLGTTQVSEIKKWSFNPKIESKEYVSNKTGGAKKRLASNKDGSGSIDGVWDPWSPVTDVLDVGSEVVLKLQHTTGQFWLVPALIEDMTFDVDLESGDVEGWSCKFSITGAWTKPVALPPTTPAPMTFAPETAVPLQTPAGWQGQPPNPAQGQAVEQFAAQPQGSQQPAAPQFPTRPLRQDAQPLAAGMPSIGAENSTQWQNPYLKGQGQPQPQAMTAGQKASPQGPTAPGLQADQLETIARMVAERLSTQLPQADKGA